MTVALIIEHGFLPVAAVKSLAATVLKGAAVDQFK
jgi:hypothetical protein